MRLEMIKKAASTNQVLGGHFVGGVIYTLVVGVLQAGAIAVNHSEVILKQKNQPPLRVKASARFNVLTKKILCDDICSLYICSETTTIDFKF